VLVWILGCSFGVLELAEIYHLMSCLRMVSLNCDNEQIFLGEGSEYYSTFGESDDKFA
jgi:hypothetical protein